MGTRRSFSIEVRPMLLYASTGKLSALLYRYHFLCKLKRGQRPHIPVLDEFENRGLTLKIKRIKCFPFALRRRRNLKIQQSLVNLESFSTKYDRRYDMIIVAQSFSKRSVFKLFSVHMKTSVFKFFRFEERFRKPSFSWRISVDGRPNAVISNFFGAVCALPYSTWKIYIFSSTPRQKSGLLIQN